MPDQFLSTFRCASMNSSSRPGFTWNRTQLNAVMTALPASCDGEDALADQDGNEQEAGGKDRYEQFEVIDRAALRLNGVKLAHGTAAELTRVAGERWAGELHGKSLTRFLPCSQLGQM